MREESRPSSLLQRGLPLRALVLRVEGLTESPEQSEEYLEELLFLVRSAGYEIAEARSFAWRRPDPATFLTRGRVEEIQALLSEKKEAIDFVLIDAEVSPVQVRNLEKAWGVPVTDREGLILEIFARNARTAQAKAQVEVARLEYELPRLAHQWTHLSRERGGIGLRGGGRGAAAGNRPAKDARTHRPLAGAASGV
jgi:GTP-binding protein HflX